MKESEGQGLRCVLVTWGILLVVKIFMALLVPFANDEAYYWVWGHHPALCYFDHPPMVAWLFWLGAGIENIAHAARLPAVLLGHCSLLIWIFLLRGHMTSKRLIFWLVFVSVSPLLGLGSLIITPDVPLLFFWSLSLFLFLLALKTPNRLTYASFGAALGLGFLSKYLIVLFVPAAIFWLIGNQRWRRISWHLLPWTLVAGLVFSSPVIFWNATNDWESFAYQLGHGLKDENPSLLHPVEYLGAQIAILFPPVVWLATRRRESQELSWLHPFAWIPIGFFFFTAFFSRPEANWPMMAYPAILALAVLNAQSLRILQWTLAGWGILAALVVSQAIFPWLPINPNKLKTNEASRFDSLMEPASQGKFQYLGSYQMAAAVSYRLKTQIPKLPGMRRRDFYDFLFEPPRDAAVFTVARQRGDPLPPWVKEAGFQEITITPIGTEFEIVELRATSP